MEHQNRMRSYRDKVMSEIEKTKKVASREIQRSEKVVERKLGVKMKKVVPFLTLRIKL